jgi:Mg2+/Co2+ transporter CorB
LDDIPISALLVALAVCLLISGFFSISETSMMALNRYRLKHLASQGHRGARLAQHLLSQVDKLLGVVLLGNNLVNAFSAALVTVITFRLLGENEWAVTIGTLAVTFAILVFSEVTPKVIGATYPERIALPASFILTPLLKLTRPIVWFVNLFVRALLWLLRINPEPEGGHKLSLEELRSLVLESSSFFPQKHRSILMNLFDLEDITVDDVMTPRKRIEAIDIDGPIEEAQRQIATSYHTRLPAYKGHLDEIVGIIHVRKLMNLLKHGELTRENLERVLRDGYYIPSGTPLLSQLQRFQESREKLGLVVDEYGELMGLVTVEDILEELIGEFTTQSPLHGGTFKVQEDGSILVEGNAALRELNRKLGLELPLDGPKTVNGLLLEHLQDIPEPGTGVKISGYPIEILQAQERVIKSVRIFPRHPA